MGTTPGDLANIMTEAFNDPNGPDRGRDATVPSQGMDVEIALRANGTSVHCFPTSGPPTPDPKEIAQFSKAQAQLMFNAVRP